MCRDFSFHCGRRPVKFHHVALRRARLAAPLPLAAGLAASFCRPECAVRKFPAVSEATNGESKLEDGKGLSTTPAHFLRTRGDDSRRALQRRTLGAARGKPGGRPAGS